MDLLVLFSVLILHIHFPLSKFYVHRILNILFCLCVFYFVWLKNRAIQYHIDSIQEYVMILKFERFSHISYRCFKLGSPIRFEVLSLVISLKVGM